MILNIQRKEYAIIFWSATFLLRNLKIFVAIYSAKGQWDTCHRWSTWKKWDEEDGSSMPCLSSHFKNTPKVNVGFHHAE